MPRLNMTRATLIEKLETIDIEALSDTAYAIEDLLTEVIVDHDEGAPLNRYLISQDLGKYADALHNVAETLSECADKYRLKKDGIPADEPKEEVEEVVEEKHFKLSNRIVSRNYYFENGEVVRVPNPRELTVKASGNRELISENGTRYVIHKGYSRYEDVR